VFVQPNTLPSFGLSHQCRLVVCIVVLVHFLSVHDATDLSFSLFLKSKDQTVQAMILLIKGLHDKENIVVKMI